MTRSRLPDPDKLAVSNPDVFGVSFLTPAQAFKKIEVRLDSARAKCYFRDHTAFKSDTLVKAQKTDRSLGKCFAVVATATSYSTYVSFEG